MAAGGETSLRTEIAIREMIKNRIMLTLIFFYIITLITRTGNLGWVSIFLQT